VPVKTAASLSKKNLKNYDNFIKVVPMLFYFRDPYNLAPNHLNFLPDYVDIALPFDPSPFD